MIREGRVAGLVINWSPVEMAGLHVDPLTIAAGSIIDTTGHATEVLKVIERKADMQLATPSGKLVGERSMWAEKAERLTMDNTRQICPGVYVAGMSANAFRRAENGADFRWYAPVGRKSRRINSGIILNAEQLY